jgi:hypothetical protein
MKRMTRSGFSFFHCKERAERETRQSIVYRGILSKGGVRLLRARGSPRPQGARDDKGGIFTMKGMKRSGFSFCHCEEGTERGTRQSIVSRGILSKDAVRLLCYSGSPRPQGARDDKSV